MLVLHKKNCVVIRASINKCVVTSRYAIYYYPFSKLNVSGTNY